MRALDRECIRGECAWFVMIVICYEIHSLAFVTVVRPPTDVDVDDIWTAFDAAVSDEEARTEYSEM